MKSKVFKIIGLIVMILVIIILFGYYYLSVNGNMKYIKKINYNLNDNLLYNEIFSDEFSKVYIDSTASEIIINKSLNNNFKVVVYGDKKESFNINNDYNVLKVSYKQKKCIGFCINNKIGKIEIDVPENYENKIYVKNNFGNIKISNLKNTTLNIEEDAGNIFVKEVKDLIVNNNFGNIEINKVEFVHANEAAGNIQISKITKGFKIKNNCGDINIKNISITMNSSIKNDLGSIKLGKTNNVFIDAETDLGDVKINNNYKDSNVILKLRNDCGDIVVNN